MPVVDDKDMQFTYGAGPAQPVYRPAPQRPRPTLGETVGAAFDQNNTVASFLDFNRYLWQSSALRPVDGYEPWDDLAGYEDQAFSFADSRSPAQTALIKRRIDDERRAKDTLDRAGVGGVLASIGAGVLDPVNLVPVGGQAIKGGGILRGAYTGLASAGVAEGILQGTQVDRTTEETLFSMTGGALFGAVLGGVGEALLKPGAKPKLERVLEAEYRVGRSADEMPPEFVTRDIDTLVTRQRAPDAPDLPPANRPPFSFDDALAAMREGYRAPKQESLVEFLARTGGINDAGGELSAIDADLWHRAKPFRRRLLNEEAQGLDAARERLVEAGYLPEGASADDVVQAVRSEMAGNPLYSLKAAREGEDMAAQVAELEDLITRAGIDLAQPDDAIRNAVRDYLAERELEDALTQWEAERELGEPGEDIDGVWVDAGGLSAQSARRAADDYRPGRGVDRLTDFEAKNPISDNPLLRATTSPSAETGRIMSELAEIPFYQRMNERGVASPVSVEANIRSWSGPLADALTYIDEAFARYRMGRPKRAGDMLRSGIADLTGQGDGKLSYRQFKEEVARAMRRGDTHQVKEVAEAAREARKRLVDPLKDDAIENGLLPEGVKVETAPSYLMRVYDLEYIGANRNAVVKGIADWFAATSRGSDLTYEEMLADAGEVVETLLGGAPGRTSYDLVPDVRGPLKERTLNIPDEVLDRLGMLENDIERVLRIYTRTMAADVEIARAFGRPDMREQVGDQNTKGQIQQSYEKLMARTKDGPKQAELRKRMERDVLDVSSVRDRLRGTYGRPENPGGAIVRIGRALRTLNYVRLLGGMTLSAVPDVARVSLAGGGLGKTMQRGLLPLLTNLKGVKLAAREVQLAGTALDMVLDTRAMQMADVFEDFGRYSKVERGLTYLGEKFGIVSGMSLWNGAMKQFAGVMIQARMLQAIMGDATPAMRRRLRFLGVSSGLEARIKGQFAKHGAKDGEVWIANTEAWTDKEARRAYRAALAKEVDSHIISPGQEKPLWMSSELGKTIGQFKSFTFASMSRALIRGLQERDAATAQAAVLAVGLGMMTYYFKTRMAGKEPSENPAKWVLEGIDRGGLTGWLMEANNMAEKVSGGRVGLNPAIGEAPASRFASRGATEAVLGPSIGLIDDAVQSTGAISQAAIPGTEGRRPMTRAEVRKIRRLLPFQNVPYLDWLFDAGEDAAGDAMGIPEETPR